MVWRTEFQKGRRNCPPTGQWGDYSTSLFHVALFWEIEITPTTLALRSSRLPTEFVTGLRLRLDSFAVVAGLVFAVAFAEIVFVTVFVWNDGTAGRSVGCLACQPTACVRARVCARVCAFVCLCAVAWFVVCGRAKGRIHTCSSHVPHVFLTGASHVPHMFLWFLQRFARP